MGMIGNQEWIMLKYDRSYNLVFIVLFCWLSEICFTMRIYLCSDYEWYASKYYTYDITSYWRLVEDLYTYIKNNGYTCGDSYYHNWSLGYIVQIYNSEINKNNNSVMLTGTYDNITSRYSDSSRNRSYYQLVYGSVEGGIAKLRYIKFLH